MVHAAIVIHDVVDVDYHKVSTLPKLSIHSCLQLISNILLMLVRRREHNKLISLTLTKIGTVIKFVL